MLYYTKHFVDSNDIKYVKKILKEKKLTQGKYVNLFENKLKTRFGSKYCTVLSNGTAALFLAIKSLNLKKRSKVITTPITFSATVSSALMKKN